MVLHAASSRASRARLAGVRACLDAAGIAQVAIDLAGDVDAASVAAVVEEEVERVGATMLLVADDARPTVAGAMTARRLGVPVARLGAGRRSRCWGSEDEVNRVTLDALAAVLFTDGEDADRALGSEGVDPERVHRVGSTMADVVLRAHARRREGWRTVGVRRGEYVLVWLNHPENIDDDERLARITEAVRDLAREVRVILALEAPVRDAMRRMGDAVRLRAAGVVVTGVHEPAEFLSLEAGAGAVVTDSAGVQEETTVLRVPCYTLRAATEVTMTLTHGTNVLLGDDPAAIAGVRPGPPPHPAAPIRLWDGQAGRRVTAQVAAALAGGGPG